MTAIPKPTIWYDNDWQAQAKIDLTQPVKVHRITSLDNVIYGLAKDDGSDLVFCASDGVTKLRRDVVSFDRFARTCEIYVEVDFETEVYLYYRNPDADEPNDRVESAAVTPAANILLIPDYIGLGDHLHKRA